MKRLILSHFAISLAAILWLANVCPAQSNLPPTILSQPQNVVTTNGGTASFSVAISGTQPLEIHWQFNGVNLTNSQYIYDATATTVTLELVSLTNAGPYQCVITNFGGAVTSSVATLAVVVLPVITNQPVAQIVTNTNNIVTFTVGASGTGPLSYQWLFNGKFLPYNPITTVAGNGSINGPSSPTGAPGNPGDGGAATNASLYQPTGVAVDDARNVFIADKYHSRIRKVNAGGLITTVAGNGFNGYSGNGSVATNSELYDPAGVAVDADGNLVIADTQNQRVREETYDFLITVAGDGLATFSGDGGSALSAALNQPSGVAVDADGNIYLADMANNRIRKVDLNDIVTTVAGNGQANFSGDGGPATNASLDLPYGLAVDAHGNVFIADTSNNRIREVTTNGSIITVAGSGVEGYNGDGRAATNTWLNHPSGVCVDASGQIFFADTGNDRIRKVAVNGTITTVAGNGSQQSNLGDGGAATNALLEEPYGIAVDSSGNLFIADTFDNRIREVTTTGNSYTLVNAGLANAGNYQVIVSSPYGSVTSSVATLAVDLPPTISQQSASLTVVNGGIATFSAFAAGSYPFSYQWQFNGVNLTSSQTVIDPTAASLTLESVSLANAGAYQCVITNLWGAITSSVVTLTIAYPPAITNPPVGGNFVNGTNVTLNVGVAGTGPFSYQWLLNGTNLASPLITTVAGSSNLFAPCGVAADQNGNLFIADSLNNRLCKIDASGNLTTIAGTSVPGYSGDGGAATNATLNQPYGIAVDALDDVFFSDASNERIREINPGGIISTIAGNGNDGYTGDGGAATNATLNGPTGIALATNGSLFIADELNQRVRLLNPNGTITTVAGNGVDGFLGDGALATVARLYQPTGVAVDAQGDIFIADQNNLRIREVTANGIIVTVAGNGGIPYGSDGIAATNAGLYNPCGVAVDGSGNLFIADTFHDCIRKVDTAGFISTVAGDGVAGYSGDGGPALAGTLNSPRAVAVNSVGNLFIADTGNSTIREVTLSANYPTVMLNNLTTNNAGNYQVVVTSPWGSVTSSIVTLNVVFPPAITNQPLGQTIVAGGNVIFTVGATGTAPLSYQWQCDGTNLTDGGDVSGSATTNLVLTAVTANSAGLYDVIISNPWGAVTSSIAPLAVVYPAAITAPPASATVINGGNAGFTVAATGTGPLAYQWQFDGTNLIDGGDLSGSTTTNLVITGASAANGGLYDVIVSNAWGSVTSSVVVLTIAYPPAIAGQPAGGIIVAGTHATLTVAVSGTAPFSYQWQFNGTNLIDGGNLSGSASINLNLVPVTTNNAGLYDVIVTNAWGSVTSLVASVTVVSPPAIVVQPAGLTILSGANATFAVQASGTSPLFYQWQFAGMNLTDGGQISGSATPTLLVKQITTNNVGLYDVVISNAWGSVTSVRVGLTNALPPAITVPPPNLTYPAANLGENFSWSVTATGTPPLSYQWQFNGTNIPANSNARDATTFELVFDPLETNNAGAYDVVVTNFWGSVTSRVATLTILYPPVITNQPLSQVVTNAKSATFTVGASGVGPLTYQWLFNGHIITNNLITTVAGTGIQQGLLGDGGPATNASLSQPFGVALDGAGNLYIADTADQRIRKVNPSGIITTFAGNGDAGYNGNGNVATNSWLDRPYSVAVDPYDDVFIADKFNSRVREVAYDIMITLAGTGNGGYSGDGGAAYNAELNEPSGIAVDASGNIYIADTENSRIRKVDVNDNITTIAGKTAPGFAGDGGPATNASLAYPAAIALDASGDLFIADTANMRIREVSTNGIITTIAGRGTEGYFGDGGLATNAFLNTPSGLALDGYGNLYIADTGNNRIRKVNPAGIITTVAGSGILGFSGDGGAATNAWLYSPAGVAVDTHGDLFIADTDNQRIREVTPQGPVLTVANLTTTNDGNYQVIVSGPGGSVTSIVATLTIEVPPTITQQPVSLSVISGGMATFAVTAGPPKLAYQWQFDGANLASVGLDGPTLTISPVTAIWAGAYQLVISNLYGSVTSSVAYLTVSAPQISRLTTTNGSVTLNLLTAGNTSTRVLAATNLVPPVVWLPIYTNVPGTNGLWQFTDTNTTQFPLRFYRTSTP